jgi:uncharacterized protein (TIGR00159 family)
LLPRLAPPLSDLIDVALVAALCYAVILALRGTRAHLTLAGIAMLGGVYLLARALGLALTAAIFQAFFAVAVLVLVVVFQREIRQFFERLAVFGLRRGREPVASGAIETLTRVAAELAATRRGALIVLPGRDPVERHLEGGIALEGELSFPLLIAIFDPHSPGHDGAVLVDGSRVRRFATHLPLSTHFEKLRLRGTRHAAALGLAEATDALCIVVSEERGTISVAHRGELRELASPAELGGVLQRFAADLAPPLAPSSLGARLLARWREVAIAVTASVALWLLVVPGSEIAESTVVVPISVDAPPNGWKVESVEPTSVEVRVSGLRRDLFLLDPGRLQIDLDAYLVEAGRRTFWISADDVRAPPGITVLAVSPEKVRLHVTASGASR